MAQPRRRLWQSAAGQAVVGPCPPRAVEGPSRSVVATVFSYVLNGYVSVKARMTSTGAGKTPNSTVGVDISNTHLDVYVGPAGQAARVPNDAAGFTALIAWVEVPVRAVTDEPWHRAFEEALLEAGLPLVRVNPLHARRFAQAIGQRAKTRRGERVVREATRRGFEQAGRRVVLGDGALWIWNLADAHFPGAIQIVDLYHAKGHLWDVAKAIYGAGSDLAEQWAKTRGCWRRWAPRWTCGPPRPRRRRRAPSRHCRWRATRWSKTAPPP